MSSTAIAEGVPTTVVGVNASAASVDKLSPKMSSEGDRVVRFVDRCTTCASEWAVSSMHVVSAKCSRLTTRPVCSIIH